MFFSPRTVLATTVLSSFVLLAGCSGEPSSEDMKAALQRSMDDVNNMTSSLFGPDTQVEILNVEKLGCEKQERGYLCDVEVESKVPIVGVQRKTRPVLFIEGENHWVVAD